MLRTLVIMMSVSTALVMMACTPTLLSSSVASSPQQLAMETKQVVRDIRNEEQNVFNILHDNLQKINQLKGQAGNDPAKSLNEAVTQLEEVTAVFEDKAKHKEEVRKEILQKVGKLHDLRSRAQNELAKLQEKRSGFQQEIAKANVEGGNHAEVKKKALNQAIRYVDEQIRIWNKFIETYTEMEIQINAINQRVDQFLAIIEASAIVYREALNLLTLQRDVRQAFSLLSEDVPEMERLSQEMEESWKTLDKQVQELLSISESSPSVPTGS